MVLTSRLHKFLPDTQVTTIHLLIYITLRGQLRSVSHHDLIIYILPLPTWTHKLESSRGTQKTFRKALTRMKKCPHCLIAIDEYIHIEIHLQVNIKNLPFFFSKGFNIPGGIVSSIYMSKVYIRVRVQEISFLAAYLALNAWRNNKRRALNLLTQNCPARCSHP